MRADGIGLYVHVPFCIKKCNYCDFCSFAGYGEAEYEAYTDALITEIYEYKKVSAIRVDTIFFGGGTPSLLPIKYFERIVLAIKEAFDVSALSEFTLEVNPKTLDREKCIAYKALGVNRISIGLQSVHETEMKTLGRVHTLSDFDESYALAEEYFSSVSVDLMYGIPHQTMKSFESTLRYVIEKAPEHISVYGLIIEEGTPFYEMKTSLPLPSEDDECDMYAMAAELLADNGYLHYEISNYSKCGYSCRHNLKYWHDEEYIGVGPAAASYFGRKRYVNTESFSEYLTKDFTKYRRMESVPDEKYEYSMLRLRLREGILLEEYKSRFGEDFTKGREEKISEYEKLGYLSTHDGRIHFTENGFYISNYLLSELL